MFSRFSIIIFIIAILNIGCSSDPPGNFSILKKSQTNLSFRNLLKETEDFNIFKYQYFYNGGGVSIADFNNDDLEDIFFTGNMVKNRLFLNKGNLKFKDITEKSGVAKFEGWCTGTNAVDINNDGWMDIYVCRAAYPFENLRKNLLFINNKDNTFSESAQKYGLDNSAHSTHSSFFDYDLDGDLDLMLINHSQAEYSKGNLEVKQLRSKKEPAFASKFYKNVDGKYVDATEEAGIETNVLSFSLGLLTLDFNNDNYPDIYVTNDFNEPDYLFINQKDGSFKEVSESWLNNQSKFSMGVDAADIDGNDYMDIMTLDMLPEDNYMQKKHLGADNFKKSLQFVQSGFQEQYMRNSLQLNTGTNSFLELGQYFGVSNTDWSWSPLFLDFDNDMDADLFVSNGYLKDHTDLDFLQYTSNLIIQLNQQDSDNYSMEEYISHMPSILLPNYFFTKSPTVFENQNKNWSLEEASVSQGAAYADLDNDGDLEIVVSNSKDYPFIYKNNSNSNNWIELKLNYLEKNKSGIGSKVHLFVDGQKQTKILQPSRGFQSSSTYRIHFGMGSSTTVDSLHVIWPNGEILSRRNIDCCQILNLDYNKTSHIPSLQETNTRQSKFFSGDEIQLNYKHTVSEFSDLDHQRLLPYFLSDTDPSLEVADFNNDNLDDIVIASSGKQGVKLFLQKSEGAFSKIILDKTIGAITDLKVEDIDENGSIDIIVARGGCPIAENSDKNQLAIYFNDGSSFNKSIIPLQSCNPGTIVIGKFDKDDQADIFVAGNYWRGQYPLATNSLFISAFATKDQTIRKISQAKGITICEKVDVDNDGNYEIVATGHWTKPTILDFKQDSIDVDDVYFKNAPTGLWNSISVFDINQDGLNDILFGNLGNNNQLQASHEKPLVLSAEDVDKNGSIDPIFGCYVQDNRYPLHSREDLLSQIPDLKKVFTSFSSYAKISYEDLLNQCNLNNNNLLRADTLSNMLYVNNAGKFTPKKLPNELQYFPIYTAEILSKSDNSSYLFIGGNKRNNMVYIGNLHGSIGTILKCELANEVFSVLPNIESGFSVAGEFRDSDILQLGADKYLVYCPVGEQLSMKKYATHGIK